MHSILRFFDDIKRCSKLEDMFFGIVPMFVLKDFVRHRFVAQIRAKMCVRAEILICAYLAA